MSTHDETTNSTGVAAFTEDEVEAAARAIDPGAFDLRASGRQRQARSSAAAALAAVAQSHHDRAVSAERERSIAIAKQVYDEPWSDEQRVALSKVWSVLGGGGMSGFQKPQRVLKTRPR